MMVKIGLFVFGMIVGANLVMILAVLYYGRGEHGESDRIHKQ